MTVGLIGSACTTGGDGAATTTTAQPGATAPADPDEVTAFDRAVAMLLTEDDVPRTWTARPAGTPRDPTAPLDDCLSDDAVVDATLATAESLELALEEGEAQRLVASATTILRDEDGARHVIGLARMDAFAECFVAAFEEGVREETGDAFTIESEAVPASDPRLGDDSVGLRGVVTVSDAESGASFQVFVHVVGIRVADAVSLVLGVSIFEDAPADELRRLGDVVAARMADAS